MAVATQIHPSTTLLSRIEAALDTMRPFLQSDGGDVKLLGMDDDFTVRIALLGACRTCSMSAMTMKAGIEEAVKRAVPEVLQVLAVDELA